MQCKGIRPSDTPPTFEHTSRTFFLDWRKIYESQFLNVTLRSLVDFLKSPSFLISGSGGRPAREAPAPLALGILGFRGSAIAFPKQKNTLSSTCGQV